MRPIISTIQMRRIDIMSRACRFVFARMRGKKSNESEIAGFCLNLTFADIHFDCGISVDSDSSNEKIRHTNPKVALSDI